MGQSVEPYLYVGIGTTYVSEADTYHTGRCLPPFANRHCSKGVWLKLVKARGSTLWGMWPII